MVLANGKEQVIQKSLRAVPFRWMDVTVWERAQALEQWPNMRGLTEHENPVERLSCFDSEFAQEVNKWADKEARRVAVLLEVNLAGDSRKFGFRPDQVSGELKQLNALPRIELHGLMTMAPWTSEARSNVLLI